MAFVNFKYCSKCEIETNHTNDKCDTCRDRARRERTAAWNALTTDEKLQDLRRRVEGLERGPMRF